MNEKQMAQWEKTREQGFDRFVVKYTLIFGTISTLIYVFAEYFFNPYFRTRVTSLKVVLTWLTIFIITWAVYERRDNAYKKKLKELGKEV